MPTSPRIQYLDAIRGWAIFIVVWVHSVWLTLEANTMYMWSFAVVYPMPLFFSVSGFLRGKNEKGKLPWRRWTKMLLLLLAGSCGYALLFGVEVSQMFGGDNYYYWFFAALLVCELITALLGKVMNASGIWCGIAGAIIFWGLFLAMKIYCGAVFAAVPWADLEAYWLFYFLGVLMGRERRLQYILTTWQAALSGIFLLAYGIWAGQGAGTASGLIGGLGGVMVTWCLFQLSGGRLSLLAWFGRESLGIFLISYPVLKALAPVGTAFPRQWIDSQWQWLIAFIVAIPLTALMALLTSTAKKLGRKV